MKRILRGLMQQTEYVPATPQELADGFAAIWPELRERNKTHPLIVKFSVHEAVLSLNRPLYNAVFGGRRVYRVLRGRGERDSHQLTIFFRRSIWEQAIVVMHSLHTSHSVDNINTETRLGALEVSGYARQLCVDSGLRSADDAQVIQRQDLSFLSHFMGYKDGKERGIFKTLTMHTPAGLCESAIPGGLRCLVTALNKLVDGNESFGFKSLLASRCCLGELARSRDHRSRDLDGKVLFNLMMAAVGVNGVQVESSLPIEMEPKCPGTPSIETCRLRMWNPGANNVSILRCPQRIIRKLRTPHRM